MRTLRAELGDRSYPIVVGTGILTQAAALIPQVTGRAAFVVADEGAERHWLAPLGRSLARRFDVHVLSVPPGESSKSMSTANQLLERLAELRAGRDDLLVTLGGGMACDLGGFVASVYGRGIPLVQVPTTMLAQVDAAIGGKTAVNLTAGKNLAGTFHQPRAVISDVATLGTLGEREYVSGLAEVAKLALALDPPLIEALRRNRDPIISREAAALEDLVARCAALKAAVVQGDERDTGGRRAVLNYGHTLGHALEAYGGGRWLHGEAIAIGMVFAAALAAERGLLDEAAVGEHVELLGSLGLPTGADVSVAELTSRLDVDKKRLGGDLQWVLLKGPGAPVLEGNVTEEEVRQAARRVLGR